MAITTKKVGDQEIEWDDELGGSVVRVPDELQPKPSVPVEKEKEDDPNKSVRRSTKPN